MATSFSPNVTTAIEEYIAWFVDFAIAGYHHWRTISSKHAVARTLTLRAITSAVDANLAADYPTVPQPVSFEE